MKPKKPKVPPYIVLSYEVCRRCCIERDMERFNVRHHNESDGFIIWELQCESLAWEGWGPFPCPHLGNINIVRGTIPGGWRSEKEEIPHKCPYYLEQLLLAKHHHTLHGIRQAYKKLVSKRARLHDDMRRRWKASQQGINKS